MVTRLVCLCAAALTVTAAGCKKDTAKPDPSALSDAAGVAKPPGPADGAATASVTADAGAVAAAADAGARSVPAGADAGPKVAEEMPKNLKVLPKTWTKAKVNDYMKKQVSRGTGQKCEGCHVKGDYASDDNKEKLAARKMISLTDGLNRDYFKKKPTVTCFTCHKGKKEVETPSIRSILIVLSLAAIAWAAAFLAPRPTASAAPGKNLKVYPADTDTAVIKKDMKLISKALGVQCDHCHDLDAFDKDDNEHKDVARKMMKMTGAINAKLKKDGFKGEVKCVTCHAGAEKPKK